jgi:hypothetical protein
MGWESSLRTMWLPFRPFNVHFSSVAAGVRPQVVFDRQEIFEGFAIRSVKKDEVFAAILSIGSVAVGA